MPDAAPPMPIRHATLALEPSFCVSLVVVTSSFSLFPIACWEERQRVIRPGQCQPSPHGIAFFFSLFPFGLMRSVPQTLSRCNVYLSTRCVFLRYITLRLLPSSAICPGFLLSTKLSPFLPSSSFLLPPLTPSSLS